MVIMEYPAYIDFGFDSTLCLSPMQVEYFNTYSSFPNLDKKALESIKTRTGYDHSWVQNVKNLTLIADTENISAVKSASTNYKDELTHLDYFPQYKNLSKYFNRVTTLDLSLINSEVLLHQDTHDKISDHRYCLKIIAHGSCEDFIMVKLNPNIPRTTDYSQQVPLNKNSNVFLIDNGQHGHYVPPNPKEFIVLFVNGDLNQTYSKFETAISIGHPVYAVNSQAR